MRKASAFLTLLVFLLSSVGLAQEPPAAGAPPTEAAEVELTPEEARDAELGKAAAESIEKEFDVLEEAPQLPRIVQIVEDLRPLTRKPHQRYQVKILDAKAINAFSLPGGYLYFTQGLVEAVESDDEIAAVCGHEMAHVCLNHARKLGGKEAQYNKVLVPLILASVLSDSESLNPGAIATIGQLVAQDSLNHYGREAELEADREAVDCLHRSGRYHPVAMLTVVEGLARLEASRPRVEMGVMQTHPDARARIAAIISRLQELEIPVERRRVTRSLVASATAITRNEREIGELRLNDRVVCEPAAEFEGRSPIARAHQSAEILNALLIADLQLLEIEILEAEDRTTVSGRGQAILTITSKDAAFHESTVEELARAAMDAIRRSFQEEKFDRAY